MGSNNTVRVQCTRNPPKIFDLSVAFCAREVTKVREIKRIFYFVISGFFRISAKSQKPYFVTPICVIVCCRESNAPCNTYHKVSTYKLIRKQKVMRKYFLTQNMQTCLYADSCVSFSTQSVCLCLFYGRESGNCRNCETSINFVPIFFKQTTSLKVTTQYFF